MSEVKGTLLIVDDEPDLRDILCYSFQRKGYKTVQAENGSVAIDIVRSQKIDLVLSDIRMPGGDGMELLEEIKRHNSDLPTILFLTGFADVKLEEAYDKGCEAIFSKPFDSAMLAA